nr:reverse transcriptase domain-containing protein [Tanacetum cinerariifolium]
MQTRSSSKLFRDQTSNPTSSTNPNPKAQIRRSSKQKVETSHFEEHLTSVATMTDNRTMAEMLRAPTEGCAEAIVVPPILAEQFELKHSLINMMISEQFFGLEKDNPHDHGQPADGLKKNPPRSIITWDDLVSKFINELFPPSRTTNLRNEISNFQQKIDESFHEAWERYKDLLHACGNLLEKSPQDALTIIENKSKQTSAVTTAMTAMLKQLQANLPLAQVKAVEEICVTYGGAHPYYQCLATGGNTFLEFRDNIQGYVLVAACNYNQGNPGDRPQGVANQMCPPGFAQPNVQNNQNRFGQPQAVILKKLLEKHGDPGKFLIPCGFSELKCKALANLGASINLMPLSVWKKLGLPDLIPTWITLELANRAICTPDGIARDVFIPVGKFTFPADFVVVDYDSDPRVPFILGKPFLRTARALIDVHGEEMILRDGDERLTLNMKHDTTSYSNHPHRDLVNLINIFNISSEDCLEVLVSNKQSGNPTFLLHKEIASSKVTHEIHDSKRCTFLSEELPDIDSFNDIHPHFDDDPLSSNTTYSANSLLEEFTDELALITYPLDYDDNLTYLANLNDLFVDPTPKMFTDEHAPDYSLPSRFDVYPDDFLEIESDADNFDNDSFDSNGEKIKEAELLIYQLDLPCDIFPHSEYDSFNSQDFSRDDDLPSPDNEDKVFNPGILIHDKLVTIITRVAQGRS